MGDALGVVRELLAVGLVHERIEVLMGLQEIGRHRQWVIEIGKRLISVCRTRIKNGLRRVLYARFLLVGDIRSTEIVIDECR